MFAPVYMYSVYMENKKFASSHSKYHIPVSVFFIYYMQSVFGFKFTILFKFLFLSDIHIIRFINPLIFNINTCSGIIHFY